MSFLGKRQSLDSVFYGVNPETKKPEKDLIQKSIILESVKSLDYTSIDLSALKLKIPQEGIYVGFRMAFHTL